MSKLEPVEKDIIQTSVELDVNKGVDEIHKEQNNIENLPIENIDSEEVIHHSLEIVQEGEPEQSDITSQDNRVLGELSGTDVELEKVESIIDRLNDEDSAESSNENDQSEPIDNTPTKEQNVVDEIHDEKKDEGLKQENDEQKNPKELSFDEIVSKILTKEIKTNKDFGRVIEGRWAFKRGKTDRDLIPAIKAGKMNDSEYDQKLVKKNITKLLKEVN